MRSRGASGRLLPPLLLGVVVLTVWEAVVRAGIVDSFFLPAPSDVAVRLWEDLGAGLLGYTLPTLVEAALGCLLGAVVALPLGYLIFRSRRAAAALDPYVAASQAVPAVALAPLLMLWIGYGLVPIVILCALLVFFPIVLTTVLGLRGLDPDVRDAARLDGAGSWDLLKNIEAPLALPALVTGLRNGFTLSVTGAVVGEFVMGGRGLGMLLASRADAADTTGLFAALVVLCALAMSVYGLLGALEQRSHLEGETYEPASSAGPKSPASRRRRGGRRADRRGARRVLSAGPGADAGRGADDRRVRLERR